VPSARSWTAEDAGDDDALRGNLERLLDASDAVALAHARGLHHGGLATSNVLIDAEQRVRVVDLGVRSVFPDADGPPSAAGDRVALAERLAALLGPASPLERAWRTAARELALRAARSDAGGELATLAGFAAALRREIT
jgi:serine/threonine protein kinase